MKRLLLNAIPIVTLLILLMVLYKALFSNPTHAMPSALLNQSIPSFSLSNILNNQLSLSDQSFKRNRITILNIWATWCYACRMEHSVLMKIKNDFHVPIYAIAYKDDEAVVLSWLKKRGNPYEMLGIDNTGDVAIDFGIYGTPETFLISASGEVLYRHVGALTEEVWLREMLPIIKKHER